MLNINPNIDKWGCLNCPLQNGEYNTCQATDMDARIECPPPMELDWSGDFVPVDFPENCPARVGVTVKIKCRNPLRALGLRWPWGIF